MSAMMTSQNWVPETALRDGRLQKAVEHRVSVWVADWFPAETDFSVDVTNVPMTISESEIWNGSVVRTALGEVACKRMIAALTGSKSVASATEFLDLRHAALSDLSVAFPEGRPGLSEGRDPDTSCSFKAIIAGDIIVEIVLSRGQASALRKSDVRPLRSSSSQPLSDMRKAMRPETIRLDATVDRLDFDLNALRSLKVGDVLPVGKTLADSFDLRVNGTACPELAGRYVLAQSDTKQTPRPGLILEVNHD
ncbi:MAG: hypothetical protein AAF926_00115 [Pseudomonadota bacterium]